LQPYLKNILFEYLLYHLLQIKLATAHTQGAVLSNNWLVTLPEEHTIEYLLYHLLLIKLVTAHTKGDVLSNNYFFTIFLCFTHRIQHMNKKKIAKFM
jgi:hypothetical protein